MIDTLRPAPLQILTRDTTVVEIARLVNKAHLLIQALGGLLPGLKPESMQHITSVLDVACGPGIWTLELARRHPKISVVGIDTSESMIAYARRISQQQAMDNTAYLTIPSFAEPFPFAEASFDLINMPFIATFLKKDDWPHLLSTYWRLLRPGGLLRLTEFGVGRVNSPAYEELNQLFLYAMHLANRSLLLSDQLSGFPGELEPLLYAANFQACFGVTHTINYSYGAPLHEEWTRDYLILSREAQPLIVQMGLATQRQVDALHQQQCYEMNMPTFQAMLPILTEWEKKR
jgi:ubiquinone/menaquinone biosynthesis C-methylase UbiE